MKNNLVTESVEMNYEIHALLANQLWYRIDFPNKQCCFIWLEKYGDTREKYVILEVYSKVKR